MNSISPPLQPKHQKPTPVFSQVELRSMLLGMAMLIFTILLLRVLPTSIYRLRNISLDPLYTATIVRLYVILTGVFLSVYFAEPALTALHRWLRQLWRDAYTAVAIVAMLAFLTTFIVSMGRWQFGGYDLSLLVETGWRQIQGQRPYTDFLTTTPPGFNLGIKYAFQLFGVNWNANLYLTAIFSCLTFLWTYWLMRCIAMGRAASFILAFAIQSAAVLILCFWWYNDSALILATVFFLSCLAYLQSPESYPTQCSYVLSLMLLSLMKPNIAGVTIVGGLALLFIATKNKKRLVLLTASAAVISVCVLLANHVSIAAMLHSYLSVSHEHGSITARFGYRQLNYFGRHTALLWMAVLSTPLFGLGPVAYRQFRDRNWRGIALSSFFFVSLAVAFYGLLTNGEYRDVDFAMLLAAGGVLTFGMRMNGIFLRRAFIAILCASIAGDLYYGATRLRVYTIGPHLFYEWQDNRNIVSSGFLKDMRLSSTMIEIQQEIELAVKNNPGSYFFGPRINFNYAALHMPSPLNLPAWWEPGTAFTASDSESLIHLWQSKEFDTLIFLKSDDVSGIDHTYYPQQFLDAIDHAYTKDNRYPLIVIYRRDPTKQRN